MDGFTGLDIGRAKADISSFYIAGRGALVVFRDSISILFDTLNKKWASPDAKEYTIVEVEKIQELLNNIYTGIKHICSGAVEAASALAKANGEVFDPAYDWEVEAGSTYEFSSNIKPCSEELNGIVGMDTESVKSALIAFREKAGHAIEGFQSMPEGIAFYDPNGTMISTYNRSIKEYGQRADELIKELVADMEEYIATATDNILLAKEQATQVMNG